MEELSCHNREQIDEVAEGDKFLIFSKIGILLYCNLDFFKLAGLDILKSKSLAEEALTH